LKVYLPPLDRPAFKIETFDISFSSFYDLYAKNSLEYRREVTLQRKGEKSVSDDIFQAERRRFEQEFPQRLKQVGLIISGWGAPLEIDEYLNEAHLCYLHGIFIASMIMAGTAIEAALRIKYTESTGKKKVKNVKGKGEFEHLIEWAKQSSLLSQHQANKANKIRKFPRNKLVHIRPFTEKEKERIYELLEKRFEELTDDERKILFEYLFRTDPTERFAKEVLEIADEIVIRLFPSIGRIPLTMHLCEGYGFFS